MRQRLEALMVPKWAGGRSASRKRLNVTVVMVAAEVVAVATVVAEAAEAVGITEVVDAEIAVIVAIVVAVTAIDLRLSGIRAQYRKRFGAERRTSVPFSAPFILDKIVA